MRSSQTPYLPIGAVFKARRVALGWSQEKVAQRMGVDQAQISYIETGRNVRMRTLVDCARALLCDLEIRLT